MLYKITDHTLWHLFKDDPVRPHLSEHFRTSLGREAFVLYEDKYAEFDDPSDLPRAVICAAYTNEVPTNERELDYYSQAAAADDAYPAEIAVFYTVWSYDRGAGRDIVLAARDYARDYKHCKRYVTLSPLTDMAKDFHLRNGARLIAHNPNESYNFEYPKK